MNKISIEDALSYVLGKIGARKGDLISYEVTLLTSSMYTEVKFSMTFPSSSNIDPWNLELEDFRVDMGIVAFCIGPPSGDSFNLDVTVGVPHDTAPESPLAPEGDTWVDELIKDIFENK
jgi:hypothetical protein